MLSHEYYSLEDIISATSFSQPYGMETALGSMLVGMGELGPLAGKSSALTARERIERQFKNVT